ncbi:MAG: phytanoyl-CoA dioxygenase family protein [Planctomycetaceae bacterium]
MSYDVWNCRSQGRQLDAQLLSPLRETEFAPDRGADLRQRLLQDGYVLLRGVLDVEQVLAARQEVFERLARVGEIAEPVAEGRFTGVSRRRETVDDLGRFWQSVSEGQKLRDVSHGPGIQRVMDTLYGEPSQAHDYLFLRPGVPGRSTDLHYDHPFFARGSSRIHTAWTPLGDVPVSDGPLLVVEGSNRFDDLISAARSVDYASNDTPQVQLSHAPDALARSRGVRLLTTDFHAGDVIVFSMTLLHGSLDNQSSSGRTRLSCDVRWQPAADPVDPRYLGPSPSGTTGIGYGELNGAKPLTESWHKR